MKHLARRFSIVSLGSVLMMLGALDTSAATTTQTPANSTTATTAQKPLLPTSVPTGSSAMAPLGTSPTTPPSTTSAASTVPRPTAPAAPTAPIAPAGTATSSMTVGDLTLSHPRASFKHDHIDVYLTLKNANKSDERIGGADAGQFGSDIVQVTKDKSGKEQELPISITVTGDKSTELSADDTWLRIRGVKSEPKGNSLVPLTLYFKRSPNAVLKISLNGSDDSGSSVMDWFKK